MSDIFTTIKIGVITVSLGIASLFGWSQAVESPTVPTVDNDKVTGTFQTPSAIGLFTTSLASKITSSDTSMTLVSALDKEGTALASSTYGFIIDEGTSVEEFVLADCTGTACTNMTRGVSVVTATTSVSSLKFEHRRGASVKITTHPSVVFAMNVLKGRQNLENVIRYDSSIATTTIDDNDQNLVNVGLLNYVAFNGAGVVDATSAARGVVELASQTETASSTATGSSGNLAIPSSNATSTYNQQTAPLRVVVTQNNGTIDGNFIPTTIPNSHTYSGTITQSTTTLINPSAVYDSSGNAALFRFVASSTLAAPATTLTLSNLASSTLLKIYVYVPSGSLNSDILQLTFNGDTSANYAYGFTVDGGAATVATGANYWPLSNTASVVANTWAKMATIDVFAVGSTTKSANYSVTHYSGSVNNPVTINASGAWKTVSNGAINSMRLSYGGSNLPTGTVVYIFGSAF